MAANPMNNKNLGRTHSKELAKNNRGKRTRKNSDYKTTATAARQAQSQAPQKAAWPTKVKVTLGILFGILVAALILRLAVPSLQDNPLLNNLTTIGELPKTIIYPLDGTKIETWAILAAGFCDNGTKAKVQLGAPWWFNDQAFGIQRQFEACANLYPVSLSVGMLTDSRSFISYPRHELYRRVLCSYLGSLVERGEYFSGEEELKKTIENVCFNNVNEFFGFNVKV